MAVIDIPKRMQRAVAAPEFSTAASTQRRQGSWRLTGIGLLRIAFGVVWAIDAWLKWRPGSDFFDNFTGHVAMTLDNQPQVIQIWIGSWMQVIHALTPAFCARMVGITEVALAVGLICGVFSNLVYVVGIVLSLVIWTTAEGFGGPYDASTVDIGAAIIYVLVFSGLFLSSAGLYLGVDRFLTPRLGRWGFLATGSLKRDEREAEVIPVKASQTPPTKGKTPHKAKRTPARGKTSRRAKHRTPQKSR